MWLEAYCLWETPKFSTILSKHSFYNLRRSSRIPASFCYCCFPEDPILCLLCATFLQSLDNVAEAQGLLLSWSAKPQLVFISVAPCFGSPEEPVLEFMFLPTRCYPDIQDWVTLCFSFAFSFSYLFPTSWPSQRVLFLTSQGRTQSFCSNDQNTCNIIYTISFAHNNTDANL